MPLGPIVITAHVDPLVPVYLPTSHLLAVANALNVVTESPNDVQTPLESLGLSRRTADLAGQVADVLDEALTRVLGDAWIEEIE